MIDNIMALNPEIFRAYDIRGRYPEAVNEVAIQVIVESLTAYFKSQQKNKKNRTIIVVGHDARLSSLRLYRAAIRGVTAEEFSLRNLKKPRVFRSRSVILHAAGLITVPMLYFLVNDLKAAGGLMITASHNPKQYNGLKVVGKKVAPLGGKEIELIVTAGIAI